MTGTKPETLSSVLRRFQDDAVAFELQLNSPVIIFEEDFEGESLRVATHQLHTIPKSGYVAPRLGPQARVQYVRSQSAGEVQDDVKVTVGRTGENDLVIDDPSVSRLHAWFLSKARRGWHVSDAGSRNGTVVNGQRVPGQKPIPLEGAALLGFGDVNVQFFGRNEFLDYLRSYPQKSDPKVSS